MRKVRTIFTIPHFLPRIREASKTACIENRRAVELKFPPIEIRMKVEMINKAPHWTRVITLTEVPILNKIRHWIKKRFTINTPMLSQKLSIRYKTGIQTKVKMKYPMA
ncbi:MAG: hypothetical protein AAFR66_03955, partial [Bacteroidota bacterium]